MSEYSSEELGAIYELGRMYFETGYFAPAERIFNGLAAVDQGRSYARLGLGLVKLELGLYQEALTHLRAALQVGNCETAAKLGLCAAFIAIGDLTRAESLLGELSKVLDRDKGVDPEVRQLFEAFRLRCRQGPANN